MYKEPNPVIVCHVILLDQPQPTLSPASSHHQQQHNPQPDTVVWQIFDSHLIVKIVDCRKYFGQTNGDSWAVVVVVVLKTPFESSWRVGRSINLHNVHVRHDINCSMAKSGKLFLVIQFSTSETRFSYKTRFNTVDCIIATTWSECVLWNG